ncbi:MAG: NAD(P)H-flavin oxidoreductase [Phycisphaera sp.]|nr:NAD(P)H-flavin oxidoreductase [Phycisphaera sp.]
MSTHIKHATPDFAVLDAIANRWSPYAYDGRGVEPAKLKQCLEAARWSASSYNEQPWSLILAQRENKAEWDKALACLLEANQGWVKHAGVLILTVAKKTFTYNGKPNRVAEHDIGLAMGNLSIQATALGLDAHQMAGVNLSVVRSTYNIPEGYDPVTAVAIGYAATKANAPDAELYERDTKPRTRKKLSEFVYAGSWGQTSPLVK